MKMQPSCTVFDEAAQSFAKRTNRSMLFIPARPILCSILDTLSHYEPEACLPLALLAAKLLEKYTIPHLASETYFSLALFELVSRQSFVKRISPSQRTHSRHSCCLLAFAQVSCPGQLHVSLFHRALASSTRAVSDRSLDSHKHLYSLKYLHSDIRSWTRNRISRSQA